MRARPHSDHVVQVCNTSTKVQDMAHQDTSRTFTLKTEASVVPLHVTPEALSEFREQGLGAMNECLAHMAEKKASSNGAPRPAQDMVAEMMIDGLATDNTRKMILCALWMAHHHPNVSGVVYYGAKPYFVAEGENGATSAA